MPAAAEDRHKNSRLERYRSREAAVHVLAAELLDDGQHPYVPVGRDYPYDVLTAEGGKYIVARGFEQHGKWQWKEPVSPPKDRFTLAVVTSEEVLMLARPNA